MNKAELVSEVARQSKLPKKDCINFMSSLKTVIVQTLQKGEMICLAGFGKFYTKFSAKRHYYNPITQTKHPLKSRILLKMKPSSTLKGQILA